MGKRKKSKGKVIPVKKKRKSGLSKRRRAGLCLGAFFALAVLLYFVLAKCRIKTIVITGNETYTQDEVEAAVRMASIDNTIFYTVLAQTRKNDYLPFIERSEVTCLGKNTIKVEVHEKLRAGLLKEMSEYFYFDKDGIVREESQYRLKNVPLVSGLKMDDCVLNEQIKPREKDVFPIILKMTQLIIKYKLPIQELQFNTTANIRLKTRTLTVRLGTSSELDAKMAELPSIFSELSGREGALNMESYSEEKKVITFTDIRQKKKASLKKTGKNAEAGSAEQESGNTPGGAESPASTSEP